MFAETTALSLLNARVPDHALPRPFYTDPEIFPLDLERIWYRDWLFAFPSCEIPKAGNLRHDAGRRSIRSSSSAATDGVIRAFHNTCRHRGSTLCRATKGSRAEDRLPLPPVDLRARRAAALRPRHGRGLRRRRRTG